MTGPLYLAWRYLAYHRLKIGILVASITLVVYLPAGLNVLVSQGAAELTERADATPLLVGAPGSPLELVLNSLYFESDVSNTLPYGEVDRIATSGLAEPIALHVRFRARDHPIVGTTLEYFAFRALRLAAGRQMAVLGECVLGASAARSLDARPGDRVVSTPEHIFELAGTYPLEMRVVGVLAPAHTPDDHAIFVDVKTAWVIEGLAHGHQDLAAPEADSAVLTRSESAIVANASVVQYTEITDANRASFHFHGDISRYPLTGLIAVPHDQKAATILMGRHLGPNVTSQIVRPEAVMTELLDTVVTVQGYVVVAFLLVGAAMLATAALVFLLSLRLRRREIDTLVKVGGSRFSVATVVVSEMLAVIALSVALGGGMTLLTARVGAAAIRTVVLSGS